MKSSLKGVLFDLDGTLLDTAPDLIFSLNLLCEELGVKKTPFSILKSAISFGASNLLQKAIAIDTTHSDFPKLRERFLEIYLQHIGNQTLFFPNIEKVLVHLENQDIPWGIVTNKHAKFTLHLLKLKSLNLEKRPSCIVSGDTLSVCKPHPAPLLYACQLLNVDPAACLYVGDAENDMIAGQRARIRSIVALYGYIGETEKPLSWKAQGYIEDPIELLDFI